MAAMEQDVEMREGNASESEWEYEYNSEELEDYYLILDIPEPVTVTKKKIEGQDIFALHDRSQAKPPKPKRPKVSRGRGKQRSPGGRARRNQNTETEWEPDAASDEDGDAAEIGANEDNDQELPNAQETAPSSLVNGKEASTANLASTALDENVANREVQIIGLHESNPVISYKGNIYSCQWSTGIGSDLLFAKRTEASDNTRPALYSFGSWDLLGISSGILVANSASLLPKRHGMMNARPADTNILPHNAGTGLESMELENESARQQPLFLQRFTEIKAWKGEANNHTLTTLQGRTDHAGRAIKPPRLRGRAAYNATVAATARNSPGSGPSTGNTPRTRTPRRARASRALNSASPHQNYGPQRSALPASTSTPSSWPEMELSHATAGLSFQPQGPSAPSMSSSSQYPAPTNPSPTSFRYSPSQSQRRGSSHLKFS